MNHRSLSVPWFGLLAAIATAAIAQNSVSTTDLTSSSPTLVLPGSLALTATVNQVPVDGGVPTGNVQFFYDGTHAVGTAPLSLLSKSQKFPTTASSTLASSFSLFNIVGMKFAGASQSVLGAVDYFQPNSSVPNYPQLTVYSGFGAGLFNISQVYELATSNINNTNNSGVDAVVSDDFNQDGIPDVLVHGGGPNSNEYDVLLGKADGTFDAPGLVVSFEISGLTCGECTNAQDPQELIAVADFNGDKYPDVAYAGVGNTSGIGIALNSGATAGVPKFSFLQFKPGPALPMLAQTFMCVTGIGTGQFTSSGKSDVVLVGGFPDSTTVNQAFPLCPFFAGPTYIFTYVGQGDGTLAAPAAGDTLTGQYPTAVAVADFNKDGLQDIAVATLGDSRVTVMFGDGKGRFPIAQANDIIAVGPAPASLQAIDVNGDGYPDIVISDSSDNTLRVALNDGTGHFPGKAQIVSTGAAGLLGFAPGDFNGDGLTDIAFAVAAPPSTAAAIPASVNLLLNSASAQAILQTAPQTLPAGQRVLTATYAGDSTFPPSTSIGVAESITQSVPTLTWPAPAQMEYGTALTQLQLNATASVSGNYVYTPPAGTVLKSGTSALSVVFTPDDAFDYTDATGTQSVVVAAPQLASISPNSGNVGDPNTTLTLVGQGFVRGAIVQWNGSPLATTYGDLNHLTALVPASLLLVPGKATVTVTDGVGVIVTGAATFTVNVPAPVVTAAAPQTTATLEQGAITLSLNAYPLAVTATLTLSFVPTPPNTVPDPGVLFANGATTDTIVIPANNTAAIAPVNFQSGSTAGVITVTIQLIAAGVNITPTSLVPIAITIPTGPPVIGSAVLTRNGTSLQVATTGLSPTRDVTQAVFHFTPTQGHTLKTTDVTVSLTSAFTTWYQGSQSAAFGTQFLYTQPFTLNDDATIIGGVSVTLTNSQGTSQAQTAQ
jgi:hypothetical protein